MIIPMEALEPPILRSLIEEFVTRDGTNFDETSEKVQEVERSLKQGKLCITFDPATQSCNILSKEDYQQQAQASTS